MCYHLTTSDEVVKCVNTLGSRVYAYIRRLAFSCQRRLDTCQDYVNAVMTLLARHMKSLRNPRYNLH